MSYILPSLIALLVVYALVKRVDVFDAFVKGASGALPMLVKILPSMAAMMAALEAFGASGALGAFTRLVSPSLQRLGMSSGLVPLFVLRPFSGSAAMALLKDVFDASGADSPDGLTASIMLGSTETIFYTVALYFGSVGVKKTRSSVPVALISGAVGAALSIIAARILFA